MSHHTAAKDLLVRKLTYCTQIKWDLLFSLLWIVVFWSSYIVPFLLLSDWHTDWIMDWLNNGLTDWLIAWLVNCWTGQLTDCLIDWLTDWLTDGWMDWLTDYWLTDWLTDRHWLVTVWLTDWPLTDWLTVTDKRMSNWLTVWQIDWLVDWLVLVEDICKGYTNGFDVYSNGHKFCHNKFGHHVPLTSVTLLSWHDITMSEVHKDQRG